MGSIEPYDTAKGRRYRVRHRKPDYSQSDKRGFRTQREAELFLASVEVSKARGSFVDPALAKVTVSEWMNIWLACRKDLWATTRTRVEGIVENQVRPKLGRTPIGQLSRLEVQRWAAELPGAPDTVRKMVTVLSGALQLAVEDGRVVANPALRLKPPRVVRVKSATSCTSRSPHWRSRSTPAPTAMSSAMG
ncbi:hypothetical protein QDR37_02745 [Amnibacterium sp. CER49]|uniref:phage integrase central domain-containing protein n=1 Tax=Amnibacterium sp. CER49 TaxID=3039161 RepID=UPI00244B81C9|nr:hypothetical protein [Amnibacterium sp. CER49]MDH2442857.1 hypothetical protein [Amnibacterium sp. CER49]